MNIVHGKIFSDEDIEKIEAHYDAKYICDSSLVNADGNYVDAPAAFFYTEKPYNGSHYFALFHKYVMDEYVGLMITDGQCILDQTFDCVVAENGDVVFSRYRHDYFTSPDGSVSADGGRVYSRFTWKPGHELKMITLVVDKDKLVKKEE